MQLIRNLTLISCAVLIAACSKSSSGGGAGVLNLHVTDDPFQYDMVQSATLSVDKISIFTSSGSDDQGDDQGENGDDDSNGPNGSGNGHDGGSGGPIVIYEGAPIVLDLFHLRDGITQLLNQSTLPAGSYRQMRLRITDAALVLVNGNSYSVADGTIHLSSECTSGFKVFIDPPLTIVRGGTANVLLDFDLTQTFRPVPPNDPLQADFFLLHPVIHASNLGHTGGITGSVTQSDGMGGQTPVEGATVYVLPPGQTDTTLAVATRGTSATGTYTVLGIAPGPYDVLAQKAALSGLAAGVTIVVGQVSTVDIQIH